MDEDLLMEGHASNPLSGGVWTDDVPSALVARTAASTMSPVASSGMVPEEDRPESLADVETSSVAPGQVTTLLCQT